MKYSSNGKIKIIISVLLCIAMILPLSAPAFAEEEEENATPVIFVPGYSSSQMYINLGTENEKRIWKVDVADELIGALLKEIPALIKDGGKAVCGRYDDLFATLAPYAEEITEYLRINPDGTSVYNVELYPHSVEDTTLDKLREAGYYPDYDTLKLLGKCTDETNVYCCTLDWRLGQIDNAKILSDYIDDVLETTGAAKVNLIGVSFGGQVTASYLSLYGGEKVNKAVLHCPALDGSSIVPQLFSGDDINLSWSDTLKLVQTFRKEETDFSVITDAVSLSFLNGFIKEFIHYYLLDLFINFGSAWDLVPLSQYEALRDKLLNDGNHNAIIEKSDLYHYTVAANLKENLNRLRAEGVQISIIAGYGYRLVTDNGMTSDSVIEAASSTGALCAEAGKTLEGYSPVNCGDSSHCHISHDSRIDAATGYLPENTWFVEGMFHGMGTAEKAVSQLISELLFTDNIADVHSDTRYPQFMSTDNPFTGVFCSFSYSPQGFCSPYSTELTVTNLSKENSAVINKISAAGADLKFSLPCGKILKPGESMTVKVSGTIPENLSAFSLTTEFTALKKAYCVQKSRTQSFRFSDGSLFEISADDSAPLISETEPEMYFIQKISSFFNRLLNFFREMFSKIVFTK